VAVLVGGGATDVVYAIQDKTHTPQPSSNMLHAWRDISHAVRSGVW